MLELCFRYDFFVRLHTFGRPKSFQGTRNGSSLRSVGAEQIVQTPALAVESYLDDETAICESSRKCAPDEWHWSCTQEVWFAKPLLFSMLRKKQNVTH